MVVVPGFDGSLYWIGPREGGGGDDGEGGGGAAGGGGGTSVAYRLPLNALDVTAEPRTLCSELALAGEGGWGGGGGGGGSGGGCGLVVGERSTTLFALDVASGAVRWVREAHTGRTHVDPTLRDPRRGPAARRRPLQPGGADGDAGDSGGDEDDGGGGEEPMLLQRDEYTVA